MFQASFLDNDFNDSLFVSESPVSLSPLFDGNSVIEGNSFESTIGAGKNAKTRTTTVGQSISVYRNLNKPSFFSIKQNQGADKGKVSGYAQSIVIKNPEFKIGEASRQRVLKEKSRNVHAYIIGELVEAFDGKVIAESLTDYQRVSYSPYIGSFFYTLERDASGQLIKESISPIKSASDYTHAIVSGADILLCNLG